MHPPAVTQPIDSRTEARPRIKNKRACVACHGAKVRCQFKDGQKSCERCLKSNRECVLHVSRQGQRPKPNVSASVNVSDAKVSSLGMPAIDIQHMGVVCVQGAPYLCAPAQIQNVTRTNASADAAAQMPNQLIPVQALNQMPPANTLFVTSAHSTTSNIAVASADQQLSTITRVIKQHAYDPPESALQMGNAENSSRTNILSLKQWIESAIGFRNKSRLSQEYVSSCLRIAASLSKQISDAEQFAPEMLDLLPLDLRNWAADVKVKIGGKGRNHYKAIQDSSTPQAHNIHDIYHAEIVLGHSTRLKRTGKSCSLLSPYMQRQRIYALGLVFYEIFSGGKKVVVAEDQKCAVSPPAAATDLSMNLDEPKEARDLDEQVIEFLATFDKPAAAIRASSSICSWSENEEDDELLCETLALEENIDIGGQHKAAGRPCMSSENELDLSKMLKLDENEYAANYTNPQDIDDFDNTRPHKKSQVSQTSTNQSIELLQQIGLAIPLCQLMGNMLDSINDDLSGDEAYTKMADITLELQLMIDKPRTRLRDQTTLILSTAGFQLRDDLFMRDQEYASLIEAYRRTKTGSSELAAVVGASGVGKSYLVSRLSRFVDADHGIFLSVKFDLLKHSTPFAALVSAFNDYCHIFTETNDITHIELLVSMLQEALGRDDLAHLMKIMPNLSNIIDGNSIGSAAQQDCVNGQSKMSYLITRFIEIVSYLSDKVLCLCLDDIHWADQFSLSILEQIVMMPSAMKRIFVIVCYREDELDHLHTFKKMISNCSDFDIRLTKIHLECVDKDTVNRIVSDLLSMPPRLISSLSDIIYQKSKGNPLFMEQLLISLKRDGLIYLSLRKKRW